MRDMFEEARFGSYSKRWWPALVIAFCMAFLTELIATWVRAFLIVCSAFIWGTIDYVPSIDVMTVAGLLSYVSVFPAVSLILMLVDQRSIETLGFFKEKSFRELTLGWLLGIGLVGVVVVLPSFWLNVSAVESAQHYPPVLFVVYFLAYHSFTVGSLLIFQGYLLPKLARFNPFLALFGSSFLALFCSWLQAPNSPMMILLNIFLFNVLLGLVIFWRKNLWLATGLQSMWSFMIYHIYAPRGIQWARLYEVKNNMNFWFGGRLGSEHSGWLTVILIVTCAYLMFKKVTWRKLRYGRLS